MDYTELLEKYNLLLSENSRLIKENSILKAQLGITKRNPSENRIAESTTEKNMLNDEPTDSTSFSDVNNTSDSISKIRLFTVMDQKTVWYGSINLLNYSNAQESIMRIESSNIANELIRSIESP